MGSKIIIRPAQPEDTTAIFQLIQALAEYEKLAHLVTGSASQLMSDLFGANPGIGAVVAEVQDDSGQQVVGFALYFYNYSTFLTQRGMYLEDLFVLPEFRGAGTGKALLTEVARIAVKAGCGRFEWSVLDWNAPSIAFYQRMGADVLPDWRICRVTGEALVQMASSAS
jgi:GNAT superfamily N-acetyltransferase